MFEILAAIIGPGLQLSAPLLLSSMGGLLSYRSGVFNIALEGYMLVAAFFSVDIAQGTHALWLGVLSGVLVSGIMAAVMGLFVLVLGSDEVIVGLALNLFALGLTSYLLKTSGQGGYLNLSSGLAVVNLPWIEHVPIVADVINGQNVLVFLSWFSVLAVGWVVFKTLFGLRLRAVGEAPMAAMAAGASVFKTKLLGFVGCGLLCGLAGAALSLGSVHLFSKNMTAGIGFIAFAAVIFGGGVPLYVGAAALIFGFSDSIASLLQMNSHFPTQFVLMIPYLLAIAALFLANRRRYRQRPRPARAVQEASSAPGARA